MSRLQVLSVIFFLLPLVVRSQNDFYSTRRYSLADGLPQSQATSLMEDNNGYLWVGTHGGGIARFDGREFKTYTTLDGLLANQVMSTYLDKRNVLWILHGRGLTRFDGQAFSKYQPPEGTSSTGKVTWRMFDIGDTLFVLSGRDRISKIFEDSVYYWERALPDTLRRFHVGPKGEGCFYLDDDSFFIKTREGNVTIKSNEVRGGVFSFFNYKGDILFRTKKALYKLDLVNKTIVTMPWSTRNLILSYDEQADVFWSINDKFLLREKLIDNRFVADTILRDNDVSQVLRDSEGNTWIATNGNGLFKYSIQDFRKVTSENIMGVMSLTRDSKGTMWFGTMHKGIWKTEDGKDKAYLFPRTPNRNGINTVRVSPKGEVWVGTGYGLGRYDEKSDKFQWYLDYDGLPGVVTSCMEYDENGMWLIANRDLTLFDGTSFKTFSEKEGLVGGNVVAMHHSKAMNRLFAATATHIHTYNQGKFDAFPIENLTNTPVLSMSTYKEKYLLMGTAGGGVIILNPETQRSNAITTRDGLPSDFIYFAAPDEKDYIWIGTEKGINRVRLNDERELIENLHFNDDNGLAGLETNQNAYYFSGDERYFGLVDGVYEFNQKRDENPRSFDVHLTDVQILYGEYDPRDYADSTSGFFRIPVHPQLPPDKNHLTFYFNLVDKRYSKSIKYKYLLENFDAKWSQASSMNEVTYSNLPPGDYTFKVMATNNKGMWSKSVLEYPFTVKAPFYKTASFIAGVVILVAGMITLIFYVRIKQRIDRALLMERIRQREQEAVRKEIARDFHDEMGNQLTRIINYISLLKLNGNGHLNGSADLYRKVEDSAKYLYTGTRDFIWSIDPVNDELSKLFLHIRDFGEKLFEEKSISFRAYNEVKEPVKLPYGFSRQANLIFKEAMTNAFKYSQAKNVTLSLKTNLSGGFEMTFEDDGVGFYAGDVQKSNGLQNIRERADRINAILRIHSEKNVGTAIILNFKITIKEPKYGVTI